MLAAIRRGVIITLLSLPEFLLRLFVGRPVEIAGNRLDLRMQWLCKLAAVITPEAPPASQVPRVRADMEASASALSGSEGRDVAREDRHIEGRRGTIPIRIFQPEGTDLPVLVYYHGGGWVIGSIESHDGLCGQIAADARCIAVSVGYRLAPEHPFPAAVDDAVDGFRWVRDHAAALGGDPTRVAVGGDSAGGNLSAVVSQQCAALGEPGPSLQLLIYPATDLSAETASYDTYGESFYLTRTRMDWFKDLYIPIEARKDVRASPLLNGTLAGQPPTQLVTAGFDPLRDEGRAYAEALEAAGVRVSYKNYEGVIHGFANMASLIPVARAAYDDMVGTFRALLRA